MVKHKCSYSVRTKKNPPIEMKSLNLCRNTVILMSSICDQLNETELERTSHLAQIVLAGLCWEWMEIVINKTIIILCPHKHNCYYSTNYNLPNLYCNALQY